MLFGVNAGVAFWVVLMIMSVLTLVQMFKVQNVMSLLQSTVTKYPYCI